MEYNLMQVYYSSGALKFGGVVKVVHLKYTPFRKKLYCMSTLRFRRGVPRVVHLRYSIACYGQSE